MKMLMGALVLAVGAFASNAHAEIEFPGDTLICSVKQTRTALKYDPKVQYYHGQAGEFDVSVVHMKIDGQTFGSLTVENNTQSLSVVTNVTPIRDDIPTLMGVLRLSGQTLSVFCSPKSQPYPAPGGQPAPVVEPQTQPELQPQSESQTQAAES